MISFLDSLRNRNAHILGHEHYFKTAVFLPLVYLDGEWQVLFEKRSQDLRNQPGEICFPGGLIEPHDAGPEAAAVRETCEELGLQKKDIEVFAPLDVMVSPFNVLIYPFVGLIHGAEHIQPNPDEVGEIFYVPISFLKTCEPIHTTMSLKVSLPDDYPYELVPYGRNYPYRDGQYPQHFIIWKDKIIWGMTARILCHFLYLMGRTDLKA